MIVDAGGVQLHVQELGAGPAVAMLHGLLVDNMASWYFTAAPVLARARRVLLHDLRGHGRSERVATGYDVATMTDDLERLLAERGIERLDLVGHSYGALIALRYALRHPARVGRLVLVEAPLPPSRLEEMRDFAARSPEEIFAALPDAVREALAGGRRRARRLAESLHFLLAESSLVRDLQAEGDVDDAELAGVRCPVLCVYGERSGCRPVGARLAAALPQAELVELDGGHYLPLEAAAPLTARIEEFLIG